MDLTVVGDRQTKKCQLRPRELVEYGQIGQMQRAQVACVQEQIECGAAISQRMLAEDSNLGIDL
jgi:hypothetical protein